MSEETVVIDIQDWKKEAAEHYKMEAFIHEKLTGEKIIAWGWIDNEDGSPMISPHPSQETWQDEIDKEPLVINECECEYHDKENLEYKEKYGEKDTFYEKSYNGHYSGCLKRIPQYSSSKTAILYVEDLLLKLNEDLYTEYRHELVKNLNYSLSSEHDMNLEFHFIRHLTPLQCCQVMFKILQES